MPAHNTKKRSQLQKKRKREPSKKLQKLGYTSGSVIYRNLFKRRSTLSVQVSETPRQKTKTYTEFDIRKAANNLLSEECTHRHEYSFCYNYHCKLYNSGCDHQGANATIDYKDPMLKTTLVRSGYL